MKSTKKVLKTSIEFEVEFDRNDFEPARLKALERLARDIKVPGFRNGKAPANVVEQHVNPNDLATQTLDIAVRRAIPKLFADSEVTPISVPHVDIKKYVPGEMAEITVSADILPAVKLGNYSKLKAEYHEHVVEKQDIEDVLTRIAESFAEPSVVKRAAQLGDEVIIDFVGKKDGKAFDGGSAKDHHLRLGSGAFIPGFEDGIVGHEVGDKFNLDITFPENYAASNLAGEPVVFEVLLKQVSEVKIPAIDDALAKKTGDFEDLKALREDIEKNLGIHAQRDSDEQYKDDLLNELVDASTTEAPQSLVDEQVERIKEDEERNLKSRGITLKDYLEHNKKTEAEWLENIRKIAERRVISSIIIQALADELKIEVSDDDVDQQVAEMRQVYKNDPNASKQLEEPQVVAGIRNRMRVNATMDKLVELNRSHAKVVKVPAFPKEDNEAPKKSAKKSAKKTTKKSK